MAKFTSFFLFLYYLLVIDIPLSSFPPNNYFFFLVSLPFLFYSLRLSNKLIKNSLLHFSSFSNIVYTSLDQVNTGRK